LSSSLTTADLIKISRNLKVNKKKPPSDLPKMAQQWVKTITIKMKNEKPQKVIALLDSGADINLSDIVP